MLKRNQRIKFKHWAWNGQEWSSNNITGRITYIRKELGPLGISIIPIYFYARVGRNKKSTFFWVEHCEFG